MENMEDIKREVETLKAIVNSKSFVPTFQRVNSTIYVLMLSLLVMIGVIVTCQLWQANRHMAMLYELVKPLEVIE